jgi:hypothetical protein
MTINPTHHSYQHLSCWLSIYGQNQGFLRSNLEYVHQCIACHIFVHAIFLCIKPINKSYLLQNRHCYKIRSHIRALLTPLISVGHGHMYGAVGWAGTGGPSYWLDRCKERLGLCVIIKSYMLSLYPPYLLSLELELPSRIHKCYFLASDFFLNNSVVYITLSIRTFYMVTCKTPSCAPLPSPVVHSFRIQQLLY